MQFKPECGNLVNINLQVFKSDWLIENYSINDWRLVFIAQTFPENDVDYCISETDYQLIEIVHTDSEGSIITKYVPSPESKKLIIPQDEPLIFVDETDNHYIVLYDNQLLQIRKSKSQLYGLRYSPLIRYIIKEKYRTAYYKITTVGSKGHQEISAITLVPAERKSQQ